MRKINFVFGAVITFLLSTAFAVSAQTVLTSTDGARIDIERQNGKVVVLAVGASWLPLSDRQSEIANALAKKYNGNVAVFFIATDSANPKSKNFATDQAVAKFAFDKKLTVPVLRDPDGAATLKKFNIEQVPSFVVLDRSGRVVGEAFGGIDPKQDLTTSISRVIDRIP